VACALAAEGHAEEYHRQTKCRRHKRLGRPDDAGTLADLAQEPFPRAQETPEALGAFQKAEIEKWWPIIKAAKIKSE
jgi:hypothetical protein